VTVAVTRGLFFPLVAPDGSSGWLITNKVKTRWSQVSLPNDGGPPFPCLAIYLDAADTTAYLYGTGVSTVFVVLHSSPLRDLDSEKRGPHQQPIATGRFHHRTCTRPSSYIQGTFLPIPWGGIVLFLSLYSLLILRHARSLRRRSARHRTCNQHRGKALRQDDGNRCQFYRTRVCDQNEMRRTLGSSTLPRAPASCAWRPEISVGNSVPS